jgi:hypothetical protein
MLYQHPILQIPDLSSKCTLVSDVSDVTILTVLCQKMQEDFTPIACSGYLLSPMEQRYLINEMECLTVLYGFEEYHVYLEHTEFYLHMDNQALTRLLQHTEELGRIRCLSCI